MKNKGLLGGGLYWDKDICGDACMCYVCVHIYAAKNNVKEVCRAGQVDLAV